MDRKTKAADGASPRAASNATSGKSNLTRAPQSRQSPDDWHTLTPAYLVRRVDSYRHEHPDRQLSARLQRELAKV